MKSFKIALATALVALTFSGCTGKKDNNNTITIGSIGPLSGGVAVYGIEAKNGAELAIEQINAAGGVNGKQVVLIAEDDEGDPAKTVNAFKKLTVQNKVKIIIGSLTSGCTKAITDQSQAAKVVQVAPAATAENITLDSNNKTIPYVFRACFIDPFQGTVGAKFALESLNAKKAAILYDIGNDYSVGLTENFEKTFTAAGCSVVKESYSTGEKDFNAQITKIKNSNPDVVYLPDYYATVALIAKQLRAQGVTVSIVGADGWDGLTENAGDEVLNGFYSNHYAADSTESKVQTFVSAYKAKYGYAPNAFSALGYDSACMILDAIKNAGTEDAAKVRDALEACNGDYVTGHITFDAKHNPIKSAVMVELVKDSEGKLTSTYKTTVNP